jgi:hypothetical protein
LPWQETDEEWWSRWDREHRWSELAGYNARLRKGIVHDPAYVQRMAEEQRRFDEEHGRTSVGLPMTLEPGEGATFLVKRP